MLDKLYNMSTNMAFGILLFGFIFVLAGMLSLLLNVVFNTTVCITIGIILCAIGIFIIILLLLSAAILNILEALHYNDAIINDKIEDK